MFLRYYWGYLQYNNHDDLKQANRFDFTRLHLGLFITTLERSAEGQLHDMSKGVHEMVVLVFLIVGYGKVHHQAECKLQGSNELQSSCILDLVANTTILDCVPSVKENEGSMGSKPKAFFLDRWLLHWSPLCIFRHAVNTGFLHNLHHRVRSSISGPGLNSNSTMLTVMLYTSLLVPFLNTEYACQAHAMFPFSIDNKIIEEEIQFANSLRFKVKLWPQARAHGVGVWLWQGLFTNYSCEITLNEVPLSNRKLFQLPCVFIPTSVNSMGIFTIHHTNEDTHDLISKNSGIVSFPSDNCLPPHDKPHDIENVMLLLLSEMSESPNYIFVASFVDKVLRKVLMVIWGGSCSTESVIKCLECLTKVILFLLAYANNVEGVGAVEKCISIFVTIVTECMAECIVPLVQSSSTVERAVLDNSFHLLATFLEWLNTTYENIATQEEYILVKCYESIALCFASLLRVKLRVALATEQSCSSENDSCWECCQVFFSHISNCDGFELRLRDNHNGDEVVVHNGEGRTPASWAIEKFLPAILELSNAYYCCHVLMFDGKKSVGTARQDSIKWSDFRVRCRELLCELLMGNSNTSVDPNTREYMSQILANFFLVESFDCSKSLPIIPFVLSEDDILKHSAFHEYGLGQNSTQTRMLIATMDTVFYFLKILAFSGNLVHLELLLSEWYHIDGVLLDDDGDDVDILTILFPKIFLALSSPNASTGVKYTCTSARQLLKLRLLEHLASYLLWDLNWYAQMRSRIEKYDTARQLHGSCTEQDMGLDEVTYLQFLLECHLRLGKSSTATFGKIPYVVSDVANNTCVAGEYKEGRVESLALALMDNKELFQDDVATLVELCSTSAENVIYAEVNEKLVSNYVEDIHHENVYEEIVLKTCLGGKDAVGWVQFLGTLSKNIAVVRSQDTTRVVASDTVDSAFNLVLHKFGYIQMCQSESGQDVNHLLKLLYSHVANQSEVKGDGNYLNWCQISFCLLQHQSNVRSLNESSLHLQFPSHFLPMSEFICEVELNVDMILAGFCFSDGVRQLDSQSLTYRLLTRNVLNNWYFNWITLNDILTLSAMILLAPSNPKQKTNIQFPAFSSPLVNYSVRICSIYTAALVHFLVTETCKAMCKWSNHTLSGSQVESTVEIGHVLEFYQYFVGERNGEKIRLCDLESQVSAVVALARTGDGQQVKNPTLAPSNLL